MSEIINTSSDIKISGIINSSYHTTPEPIIIQDNTIRILSSNTLRKLGKFDHKVSYNDFINKNKRMFDDFVKNVQKNK